MKKIVKFWLILLVFSLFVNVKAVELEAKETKDDNNQSENNNQSGSDGDIDIFDDPLAGLCDQDKVDVKINGNIIICNDDLVCEYKEEDNAVNKVTLEYGSTCDTLIKEEKSIVPGLNTFKINAKAKSGKTYNYTINITKIAKSTDSSLKTLKVNGVEIPLKSGTNKYSTTVSYSTSKLEIEAIPNDETAKVEDANKDKLYFDLFETSKNIQIKVIAASGDVTTYVVAVSKRDEADTTLKSLSIKGTSIDFESSVYDYELSVFKSVTELDIDAIATDTKANVKINKPETLEMGLNTVTIVVENDGNEKTYTLKITRLDMEDETVANLKSLKIKGYDLDFKEDKYEYNLKIGDVNYLDIDVETLNPEAKYEITGNADLVNGSIIKIKVTYNDDITRIYRINIEKEEIVEESNNLSKIIIVIVLIVLLIGGIVALIIIMKRKNNKKPNKKKAVKKNEVENDNVQKIGVNPNDVINLQDDDTKEVEEVI